MSNDNLQDSLRLPANYVRNILNLVSSRGGSPEAVCLRSATDVHIGEQAEDQLNWQQFSDMIRESRNEINEPALGLYLGSQLTITTHGLLGLAAMSSATLGDAGRLACQYVATRTPLVSLKLEKKGSMACLTIEELYALGDIRATFLEALAVTLYAVLQFVSSGQARLLQANFAYDGPDYRAMYEAFFPCKVCFNQTANQLLLPWDDLAIPSNLADQQVQRQAAQQCEQQLQQWRKSQRYSGQIQRMLGRAKGQFPTFDQVADELAMSTRTLRRRLQEEGTSYQELLEKWRYDMAHQYLLTTRLSIQQISYLLGYNDPANFGRAFRKTHAGVSPLNFRKRGGASEAAG